MNAETTAKQSSAPVDGQASMGPRSHERGNREAVDKARDVHRLQWGRVLMNAETKSWRRCSSGPPSFNGAAFS